MSSFLEQFRNLIGNEFAAHLLNGLLFLAGALAIGFLVKQVLHTAGRKLIAKTETELDDRILEVILPRVKWLAIVMGLYWGTEEAAKGISNPSGLQLVRYLEAAIYLAAIALVAMLAIRLSDTTSSHLIERHAQRTSSKLNEALLPLLHRLIMVLIILIAVIMALGHFGVDVSSLLVFLGGSSVAVALAAQDTLQNMISGFVIMLDRPFRVGDRIKLPSGEVGDVVEIGLRSTKVLDFDNNLIVSPNAELVKTKVINYSYPHSDIRVLVEVGVAYGTSMERARAIMLETARTQTELLPSPAPEVFLLTLGESACILNLIARTDDWKKKFRVETRLREQIYERFLSEGITPGHPQRIVRLIPPADHAS
jgi:MscS family membrane protein